MVRSLQISPKELSEIHQDGVQKGLTISRRERPAENPPPGGNPGKPPWPGYPNPMPPGKDWPVKLADLNMWPNLKGVGIDIPKDDSEYGEASGPNKDELERRGWSNLMIKQLQDIAGGPSFDIDPAGHKKVNKGAKMHNKTRNNPSDTEVDMIKKWLGGPQLPLADASALTDYLDSQGRNPRTGSFKGTPLGNDPQKLIETLLIGAQKFKA